MLVPYTFPMHLQTHVRGVFIVQETFKAAQFVQLVEQSGIIPKKLLPEYCNDYEEIAEYQGASIFRDIQLP